MRRLAILAALVVGCTAATPNAVSPSPTVTATATATPTPKPTPARGRSVAVVGNSVIATGDFRGAGGSEMAVISDPTGDSTMQIEVRDRPGDATGTQWMKSGANFLSLARSKFAVMDVDGDGKDDVVALHDLGTHKSELLVFHSTGASFDLQGSAWSSDDFDWSRARNIYGGRFTAGAKDSLLVTYEEDGARLRLVQLTSDGSKFTLAGDLYDSGAGKFDPRAARFAVGRFGGASAPDELAALYQKGSKPEVVLFEPGAKGLTLRSDVYDFEIDYDLTRSTVTASDVNGDGRDDLLSVYVGDDGSARVHVFDAASSFKPLNAFAGWSTLPASSVCAGPAGIIAGDWDRDGRGDVAVLSPATVGAVRAHTLASNGTSFVASSTTQGLMCPVWPLNGLPLGFGDPTVRPVYVKVDNNPNARPHYGISKADIVFEWLVEGLTTRLAAVFQSQHPGTIGGVRSVRMTDRPVLPSMGAVLVYSGGGPEELMAVHYDAAVAAQYIDLSPNYGWGYRVDFRHSPYNFFTSWDAVQQATASAPDGEQPVVVTPWAFLPGQPEDPKTGGFSTSVPATQITIPYRALFGVSYSYDAGSRTYARYDDGVLEKDAANGQVIAAKNVVVIQTEVHFTTDYGLDPAGNPKLEEQLTGSGKGVVFRDGLRQEITWTRPNTIDVFTMRDASGQLVQLDPGQTWIHVVPQDWTIPSS